MFLILSASEDELEKSASAPRFPKETFCNWAFTGAALEYSVGLTG